MGDKKDLKLAKEDLEVIARFTDVNIPVAVSYTHLTLPTTRHG